MYFRLINQTMYNFTQLAIQLNELEPNIAPTDSRFRPDQRFMEEAKYEEANEKKVQLETKLMQKFKDKSFKQEAVWFKEIVNPFTQESTFTYANEYWKCKQNQNWSKCPDIF